MLVPEKNKIQEREVSEQMPSDPSKIMETLVRDLPVDEEVKEEEPVVEKKDDDIPAELEEKPKKETKKAKKEAEEAKKKEEPVKEEVKVDDDLSDADRAFIAEMEADEPKADATTTTATGDKVKETKEEKRTPTEKEVAYDKVVSNPFIKAAITFFENGGNNPKDLIKELGLMETPKSIEDYIRQEAMDNGLTGEALENAITEEMDDYDSLTGLQKAKALKKYQETDKQILDKKFENYIVDKSKEREVIQKIQTEATSRLQEIVKDKVGTKIAGELVDEPTAQEILNRAALTAIPIYDDKGNLVGYDDLENSVEDAMFTVFRKRIRKYDYQLGFKQGAKKHLSERHRPSDNTVTDASPNLAESKDEEKEQVDTLIQNMGSGMRPKSN
jgi:hypothetical protein